jgi:hypothetical protein
MKKALHTATARRLGHSTVAVPGELQAKIECLATVLGISKVEDWYKVSKTNLRDKSARDLLVTFGSLQKMAQSLHPGMCPVC